MWVHSLFLTPGIYIIQRRAMLIYCDREQFLILFQTPFSLWIPTRTVYSELPTRNIGIRGSDFL